MTEPTAAPAETRSIAGDSILLLAARVIGNVGFFFAVLVLARTLGPTGRGTMAFLTVSALVLAHVISFGVTSATQLFAAQRPEQRPQLLANVLLFSAVVAILAGALAVVALLVFDDARPDGLDPGELVLLVPGTLAVALVEAGYFFVSGCGRFRRQAFVTATAPWLYGLALLAVAAGPGLTVTRAAVVWAATTGIWALMLFVASVAGTGLGRPSAHLLAESVRFGVRAWFGSLSLFLSARFDQILIGLIASEATLGIYAVAVNGSEVLLYLPAAAAIALLPAIARSDPERRAAQALGAFRVLVLVTGVTIVVAALLGPPLIPVVFGADFDGSRAPFLWLLPGALGFAAFQTFSTALLASAAPGLSSVGAFVALVVGIALDLILIPPYGANGAAAAASAAFLAGGVAATLAYRGVTRFAWADLAPSIGDVRSLRSFAATVRRR